MDNEAPAVPPTSGTVRTPSYLGAGITIKGRIEGDEDLKIDGKVEGPISLQNQRLTVGTTSNVIGDIVAREVIVHGNVRGNLRAHDRIEIKNESSVLGNAITPRISIDEGAYFKGGIEIERNAAKVETDPSTLLALAEKDFKLKSIRSTDSNH